MFSNRTRSTIISLVAAASLAVAVAPASALRIVKEKGGWGHYNCEIGEKGSGVFIADGEEWKENGKTYKCSNGKITVTRKGSGPGNTAPKPVGSLQGPEGGTPPSRPVTGAAATSSPLLVAP